MRKIHQKTKNNPYFLPKTLYARIVYTIMDYERALKEYGALNTYSQGTEKGTADKLLIEAVETALESVPIEYRQCVFEYVTDSAAIDKSIIDNGNKRIFDTYKAIFIWNVAKELNLI